jgi:glycerate 2-kinase
VKEENESSGPLIRNKSQLLSHGNIKGRKIILDIIEHSLRAIDTYTSTKKLISLDGELLKVGHLSIDLTQRGRIYVLGAGKASFPIAKALEDILGPRIKGGIILEKRDEKLTYIDVIRGGHPIPDENSLSGAKAILRIAAQAQEEDIAFCPITGGSSALMTLPAGGISLEDVQKVTDLLLRCGAAIEEINAVRKHLSAIKGGRLAIAIHPAEIINLTVSDVIGDFDALDVITCPTVPDTTSFADAVNVLKKYSLWDDIPSSVKTHLEAARPADETPKDFEGIRVTTFMLSRNEDICRAAQKRAEELGLNATVLSSVIEGESKDVGITLAGIAKEIEKNASPFTPPVVLISGGETTVTIQGESGEGGPNQEFVLGIAQKIGGSNITAAAIGTDGTDGPTDIAGGIVDGYTLERTEKERITIFENLKAHNSSYVLRTLGDAVYTGATGTNVMDFRLIVILASQAPDKDVTTKTSQNANEMVT